MGQIKFFKFDTDGMPIEHDPASDDITIASLTLDSGGAGIDMNSTKVSDCGAASTAGDVLVYGQSSANLNGLDVNSQKITSLADGTTATDAVNYGQLSSLQYGFDRKESCRVRTIIDMSGWTAAGTGEGATLEAPTSASSFNTIDNILLTTGERVLVVTAADAAGAADADNGIYTVTTLGDDASAKFKLTRAVDCDGDSEVTAGLFTFVTEGDTWQDTGWFIVTDDDITVDTTAIQFSQFAGVGTFTGGNGIDITSGVISVDLATNPGLEFDGGSPNKLQVKDYNGITVDSNGVGVNPDSTTGGNVVPVDVTSNGVGLDVDDIDGVGIEANGSGLLQISTQGNGITGGGGTTISVNPDSTTGGNVIPVDVTANGVGLDVDDLDGDGLQADGSGRLAVELSTYAGLELDGTSPNKTLQAKVDGSTIQINGSTGELEVLGTPEAERIETTFTTDGTGVTAGDPVYISANGIVTKCLANNDNCRLYIGCAKTTVGASAAVDIVSAGELENVTVTSPVAGALVYIATAGGLTCTIPPYTANNHRMVVGRVSDASGSPEVMLTAPQYLGKVR